MRSRSHDTRAPTESGTDAGQPRASEAQRPSKSSRKRDMLELQSLGESLVALADEKLERLPIGESLLDAIRLAREIRSREGRRRQLQYIGRLMRGIDADALRDALSADLREQAAANARMHAAEQWRERIVADDRALQEWLLRHPDMRAEIEPLVPRARVEIAGPGPGRAYRELFRKLRDRLTRDAARRDETSGVDR